MSSLIFMIYMVAITVLILDGVNMQATRTGQSSKASVSTDINASQNTQTVLEVNKTLTFVNKGSGKNIASGINASIISSTERKLKTDVDHVFKVNSDLESDVNDLKTIIIENLKSLLISMTGYLQQIRSNNIEMKAKISSQSLFSSTYKNEIPAFYAFRTTPYNKKSSVIPFEESPFNNGCFFNVTSGVFTAPVRGIYHFYFQAVKSWGVHHLTVSLLHNKEEVTAQHVSSGNNAGDADIWLPMNIQSILLMEPGDTMSLYLKSGATFDMTITPTQPWMHKFTSLAGFLIQAI